MATEDKSYRKRIDPNKDPRVYAKTGPRRKDASKKKRKILQSRLDVRKMELNRIRNMRISENKNRKPVEKIVEPSDSMKVDTTTSAYGDSGRGRPVPKFIDKVIPKKPKARKNDRRLPLKEDNYGQFSKGGEVCRGAGAAIKGTNFKGVF